MKILLTADEISTSVEALGHQITNCYRDRQHPLFVIGVLTGSLIFQADLVRQISIPHRIGMVDASSYRGKATTSGELQLNLAMLPDIAGCDVLLVDDIFDSGKTLTALLEQLKKHAPASVKTAVLLRKKACSQVEMTPDFVGFPIENDFVVGYGLDYNDMYRHYPDLQILEPCDF